MCRIGKCRSVIVAVVAAVFATTGVAAAQSAYPPPPPGPPPAPPPGYEQLPPVAYPEPQTGPPPLSPAMRVIYAPFYVLGLFVHDGFYYVFVAPFEVFGRAAAYGVEGGVSNGQQDSR